MAIRGVRAFETQEAAKMLTDDWQLYEALLIALSLKVQPGRAMRQYETHSSSRTSRSRPELTSQRQIESGQRDLARRGLTSLLNSGDAEMTDDKLYIRQIRYVAVPTPPYPGNVSQVPVVEAPIPSPVSPPSPSPLTMQRKLIANRVMAPSSLSCADCDVLRKEVDKLKAELDKMREKVYPRLDSLEAVTSFHEKALGLRRTRR